MTTPKPLPADIEDALFEFSEAVFLLGVHCATKSDTHDAALANLTALLSGYTDKAARWDESERKRKDLEGPLYWERLREAEQDRERFENRPAPHPVKPHVTGNIGPHEKAFLDATYKPEEE